MKSLVIYCSAYGNTQKVAEEIAKTIKCQAIEAKDVKEADLKGIDLLIVGSPTQGGQALPVLNEKIKQLPNDLFVGVAVATFDTRFAQNDHGFFLKMLTKTIGYAAEKLAKSLQIKGANVIGEPTGFIVTGKEGPLANGEIDRAQDWAKNIQSLIA